MEKKMNTDFYFKEGKRVSLKSKKAQITIFIVIALVLIIGVGLLFISTKKTEESAVSKSENPKGYIEDCIEKQAEKFINNLYQNGLVLNDSGAIKLSTKNISMLCYTQNYDENCIAKYPLMLAMAERDMKENIRKSSEKCFSDIQTVFPEGYKSGESEITLDIKKDLVTIKLNKKVEFIKNGQGISFSTFDIQLSSKVFDFYVIASKIISEEASCNCQTDFCRADTLKLRMENPNFKVDRGYAGNERITYTISQDIEKTETTFAVRNCIAQT